MDKREYRDKRLSCVPSFYTLCSGSCHKGVSMGDPLLGCPCDCHAEAISQQRSRDRIELLASASGR